MADSNAHDEVAAEYVLGTLDSSERLEAQWRLQSDATFAAAVETWQRRLDPMLHFTPAAEPPAGLLRDIMKAIDGSALARDPEAARAMTPPGGNVVDLAKTVRFWKRATLAAAALAASLTVFIAVDRQSKAERDTFIAVLQNEAKQPAFVASVDFDTRVIAIRTLSPPPVSGRSYELWSIEGKSTPVSLGLVDRNVLRAENRKLGASPFDNQPAGITLAVTIEPEGGSPTGKPTSNPIYVGTLVAAPSR